MKILTGASQSGPTTITGITPSAHDQNRVNVFVGGEYSFSLDIAQVVDLSVKVGRVYTLEEIENLKSASEFGKLYTRTLEWLLSRPHSIRETRDYLNRRRTKRSLDNKHRAENKLYKESHQEENPYHDPSNLDENGRLIFKNSRWAQSTEILPEISVENINLVIEKLIEKGYLDDEKFAKFFVENRFRKKGASPRRLREDLQKKGISQDIIDSVLADSERTPESEIQKIIEKKYHKYPPDKLVAYLVRQGFSYSLAKSSVESYSESDDSE